MIDLKLDTLDRKPKVYHIAVLSVCTLVLLALLIVFGGERAARWSCVVLCLYFLGLTVLLLRAFFLQMRYNLYSYNTVIYFGFSLFTLFIAATYALVFFRSQGLEAADLRYNLLGQLLNSAKLYALLTTPFLLVFSLALGISNLSLIRHEGFRPVNLLGILLALLLMGGDALIFLRDYYVTGSETEVMIYDLITNLMAAVYLYYECMMLGTLVAGGIAARSQPPMDRDYIIVLGCAIRRDGSPTPLLRGRLDRALAFARAQEQAGGPAPVFVLSGGQGPDECVSEAESMRRYLADRGVPAERMLLEDRSTDTEENMRFSKELILARDSSARTAFSTTNYHVFRSGLKARRVKLRALGMGCRTKWYFWPNAAVREFVGLLTQHRGKQALILGGLTLSYALLTWFHYNP